MKFFTFIGNLFNNTNTVVETLSDTLVDTLDNTGGAVSQTTHGLKDYASTFATEAEREKVISDIEFDSWLQERNMTIDDYDARLERMRKRELMRSKSYRKKMGYDW